MTNPKAKAREAASESFWRALAQLLPHQECLDAALDAYEAALSAPGGATRLVRIAVAEDDAGDAEAWACPEGLPDGQVWRHAKACGFPYRLGIARVHFPVREVPVVAGDVEEAG